MHSLVEARRGSVHGCLVFCSASVAVKSAFTERTTTALVGTQ
jgi:hypothetical protein